MVFICSAVFIVTWTTDKSGCILNRQINKAVSDCFVRRVGRPQKAVAKAPRSGGRFTGAQIRKVKVPIQGRRNMRSGSLASLLGAKETPSATWLVGLATTAEREEIMDTVSIV